MEQLTLKAKGHQRRVRSGVFQQLVIVAFAMARSSAVSIETNPGTVKIGLLRSIRFSRLRHAGRHAAQESCTSLTRGSSIDSK